MIVTKFSSCVSYLLWKSCIALCPLPNYLNDHRLPSIFTSHHCAGHWASFWIWQYSENAVMFICFMFFFLFFYEQFFLIWGFEVHRWCHLCWTPADNNGAQLTGASLMILKNVLISVLLPLSLFPLPAVCDSWAHAGADVQTQDIQPQPQRLPQDLPLPEMAEDGGAARWVNTQPGTVTVVISTSAHP